MAPVSVYEGKTLDEAVRKGLEALGISRAEAMITVIDEGSNGFLGFGSRPYRVRITARPGGAIREPEERGESRGSRRGSREERPRAAGRAGREERPRAARGTREERVRGERTAEPAAGGEPRRERSRDAAREAGPPREDRAPREARAPRRERPAREDRPRDDRPREDSPREDRPREDRPRRDESRPLREVRPREIEPAEPIEAMAPGFAEPRIEGETGRRRRRGRRGGRGRSGRGPRPEVGSEGVAHDAPLQAQEHSPAPAAMSEVQPGVTQTAPPRYERREMTHEELPMREQRQDLPREERPMREERVMREEHQDLPREERPMREERHDLPRQERPMREERHDPSREERPMREDRPMPRPMREERHDRPAATATAEPPLSPDALAAEGKRWTEELLKAMGFEAKVSATAEEDRVDVTAEVSTGDELLTGPKGEVRQALQHLLNRMVNRGEGSRYHLQLEINDFWKRREDELREMAARLADEAISTGAEVVTEYLNAQERRIIHVTLREDARVKTYALGDGMIKRLAVAPADLPEGSREGD